MGYEVACSVMVENRRFAGTARLETSELTFRGDTRLAIPLDQISDVRAGDGRLLVRFGGREAAFDLGAASEKWARRIANPPSRIDKLGVKPGMTVAIVGVDDDAIQGEIEAAGASVAGARARDLDMILFGARTPADLARLAPLADRIAPAGCIWLIRAKGKGAPVTEAASMAAGKRAGLVDVKVLSFSPTHTGEKYVIPKAARPAPSSSKGRR